jgi:hypothetical protein
MQSSRASSTVSGNPKTSNAWITQFEIQGASSGPLENLQFAVKDMYSVAGHTNSCGNPTWLKTHSPATSHAACVQRLLDSGATLAGMTHMDELAYSLNGENVHYGTPVNAAAADRVPGGSSSGSAVWQPVFLSHFTFSSMYGQNQIGHLMNEGCCADPMPSLQTFSVKVCVRLVQQVACRPEAQVRME